MLRNVVSYKELTETTSPGTLQESVAAVVGSLENALNMEAVVDVNRLPYQRADMADLFSLAARMEKAGILTGLTERFSLADEPSIVTWHAGYGSERAGGTATSSGREALVAALAECMERKLWSDEVDFFSKTKVATTEEIRQYPHLAPERFAGYTTQQREDPALQLSPSAKYTWIRGTSLISNAPTYVPAQIISKTHGVSVRETASEPLIRPIITTGLATGVSRTNALLGGTLEVIERDAFMIMWFNQLSLPRIPLSDLTSPTLSKLLQECARYRLTVTFVNVVTDAPTYVIGAVVSDEAKMPPIAFGLSAHATAARAAEKALLEALRARTNTRNRLKTQSQLAHKQSSDLFHWERTLFWAVEDRYTHLAFLTAGPEKALSTPAWSDDTPSEYLQRIVTWCASKGYEIVTVDMSHSKKNITSWHIHFVIIPELQPLHQNEKLPCIGGTRLSTIPTEFGYVARPPFTDMPHPFA